MKLPVRLAKFAHGFAIIFISTSAQAIVTPLSNFEIDGAKELSPTTCLDPKELESLPFDFRNPDDKKIEIEACDNTKLSFAVARSLLFIKSLPPMALPKSDFNLNQIASEPYSFFRERVETIVIDDRKDSEPCSDGRLAFTQPYWREEKKIWVCSPFQSAGDVQGTSVLVHESRHLEGAQFNHVLCQEGRLRNQRSCDEAYEDGAAYAVGLEYLVKIAFNTKLEPTIRETARRTALIEFISRFNKLPLDLKRGALLQDASSNAVYFYSGSQLEPAGFETSSDAVFSSYGGLALVYSPLRGQTAIFDFKSQLSEFAGDVLSRTFRDLSPARKKKLKSAGYGKTEACLLLTDELLCFDRRKERFSVAVKEVDRIIAPENSRLLDNNHLYLLNHDQTLHPVPSDASTRQSEWPRSHEPFRYLKGGTWGESWNREEIWLDETYHLRVFDQTKRTWREAPTAPAQYREILAPYVWSKRLQEF